MLRFVMIGGFLGAGKTTTIARLARAYGEQGLKVGIVTNDEASDLVDTHALRSQGFDVGEVAGAKNPVRYHRVFYRTFCIEASGLHVTKFVNSGHGHENIR